MNPTPRQAFGIYIFCALLFATAISVSAFEDEATSTPKISESQTASTSIPVVVSTSTASTSRAVETKPVNVEQVVRKYFANAPAMIDIARCESKFRQYTDSGNLLRGGYGKTMIGIFQFNETVHANNATSLGYDIYTVNGNLKYAEYLYKKLGTDPWISSFSWWKESEDSKDSAPEDAGKLSRDLHFGETHAQVRLLQELLNKNGFVIAVSGPGSKGNETDVFGNLTRTAVRAFQCAEKIVCNGDEYSTGYGLIDKKTRNALLNYKKASKKHDSKSTKKNPEKSAPIVITDPVERQKKLKELLTLLTELKRQLALLQHSTTH